ncbi:hypothetical protein ASE04_29450 [Rhizobium sp. Root708]|uniref:tyrosine-type recombinase/integrase n=1 Tax=Rhizobium sp. Root708 TaxID=1736592 RepID=UPI0006F36697|nr:tyrosine-type recombinase/integrase [Rhizobium sp. Root708]KRB53793.1 hypothetical protein ASE04_29450 [Rhizobium sp. Root708]
MTTKHPLSQRSQRRGAGASRFETVSFDRHELICFWIAAGQMPLRWEVFFKIMLLTAMRASELTGALWKDIDFNKGTWLVPDNPLAATRSFTMQEVPLSPYVTRLLNSLVRTDDLQVFDWRTVGNYQLARASMSLRDRMSAVCQHISPDRVIRAWNIATIRRTVSDWIKEDRGRVLAAIALRKAPQDKTYFWYHASSARRDALAAWEAYVLSLVRPNDC